MPNTPSNFPAQIDGYSVLRVVVDGVSEIIASDINNLTSAVLAIENTLGIQPAATYGTVANRFNSIADAYTLIEAHINASQDAHPAGSISLIDSNNFYLSNDVESALAELGTVLPATPNVIGQQQLGVANTGYPTFVNKTGTLFVFNSSAPTIEKGTQPSNITGFTIIDISTETPNGTGILSYVPSPPTLTWQAPGDGSAGSPVSFGAVSTGEWLTVYSSTTTKALRIALNGSTLSLTPQTDNFYIYSMEAKSGEYSDTNTGFVSSNYITHASINIGTNTPPNNGTGQFIISGIVFPADLGTLVLQRKLRSSSTFEPVAILDLGANFNESKRLTHQGIYSPTFTGFDNIVLYDRFPVLGDYSADVDASGNQIYDNYTKTFTNFQVAKYLIPASISNIVGGVLTAPPSISQTDVDGNVSAYRLIHYKTSGNPSYNFGGDPSPDVIYSISDAYGSASNDGDNTVRMSNVYLDISTTIPTINSLSITPVSNTESVSKHISGIDYYNSSSDLFNLYAHITNAFANTYSSGDILNLSTDIFNFPAGSNIGVASLFDSSNNLYSASNLPTLTADAYYIINATYNSGSRLYPNTNTFSVHSRVSGYAQDPFQVGSTLDSYGGGNILSNSYGQVSNNYTEYFLDEFYRVGGSETFNSTLSSASVVSASNLGLTTWNSSSPLSAGNLQLGGIMASSTPFVGGLIFPQENYNTGIYPTQTNSGSIDYSNASYQIDSIYQRVFSLSSTFSQANLIIKSNGNNPVVFDDLYYNNASRPLKIELKLPGISGFLDIGRLFATGLITDGYGCLDNEPYYDSGAGYLNLPFTFGQSNNSTTGDNLAVRITYFGSEFSIAKNIILTEIQLVARTPGF